MPKMREVKKSKAKPVEEKAHSEKPTVASSTEADITKALQDWASDWSRKNVKGYLNRYASDFQLPKGMTRKAWEAERAQRIDKPGKLQVSVNDIKISVADNKATVRFRQQYNSATLQSSAGKTMVFVKSAGKWLIQQERVG